MLPVEETGPRHQAWYIPDASEQQRGKASRAIAMVALQKSASIHKEEYLDTAVKLGRKVMVMA